MFLGLNGWEVDDPEGELYEAMIGVSAGAVSNEQLAGTLERLAVPYADD